MIRLALAFLTAALTLAADLPAAAAGRVALVIGNGAYVHAPALANPRADASGVAAALRRLDFDVVEGLDLGYLDTQLKLQEFSDKARDADLALFYYAGHGVQAEGRNHMIPVDVEITRLSDLRFRAVDMDVFLDEMREAKAHVVILDACRDNPFKDEIARSLGGTRSNAVSRGLAKIDDANGAFIAFATDPGNVALDGKGAHSPFTEALLKHVETPGVEISTMMTRVRAEVVTATNGRQHPWSSNSLVGEVYLAEEEKPAVVAAVAPVPAPAPAPALPSATRVDEVEFWRTVREFDSAEGYSVYLQTYPAGRYAPLARLRLGQLAASGEKPAAQVETQVAAAPAPAAPAPQVQVPAAPVAPAADETRARPALAEKPVEAARDARGTSAQPAQEPAQEQVAALTRVEPPADPKTAEQELGLTRDARREAQIRLDLLGFAPGGADGILGRRSRIAISDWQRSRGAAETGHLDAPGYAALLRESEPAFQQWREEAEARRAARRARDAERARRAARSSPDDGKAAERRRARQAREAEERRRKQADAAAAAKPKPAPKPPEPKAERRSRPVIDLGADKDDPSGVNY